MVVRLVVLRLSSSLLPNGRSRPTNLPFGGWKNWSGDRQEAAEAV